MTSISAGSGEYNGPVFEEVRGSSFSDSDFGSPYELFPQNISFTMLLPIP